MANKPGDRVPDSGIYRNPKTGDTTTVQQGDKFPPTAKPQQGWVRKVLTDPSRKPGR
jgi:hypothetical protein